MPSNGWPTRGASLDTSAIIQVSSTVEPGPPAPPKDSSRKQSISTNAPSVTSKGSPTRIRRKPLPSTAFSPRSIVSSPHSVYSYYNDDETRSTGAVTSGVVLNDILDSPTKQNDPKQTFLVETSPTTENFPLSSGPKISQSTPGAANIPRHLVSSGKDQYFTYGTEPSVAGEVTGQETMMPRTTERPPPLRVEPVKILKTLDAKKIQSPGSVFTSFFGRRQNSLPKQGQSPSADSGKSDASERRSPFPSPHQGSTDDNPSYFAQTPPFITNGSRHASPQSSVDSMSRNVVGTPVATNEIISRCNILEAELKEISQELAGSIRRELDLEDLVERLQSDNPAPMSADRTSDYFSDSGTSSSRQHESTITPKEEMDKIRREAEQQRAQMKIELSQKWQEEASQRKLLESHISILENKLQQTRRDTNDNSDASARIRELEYALDDSRRRLNEERQTRENFEDLLQALKVDLEQHRNERDNLKDEIVPKLRSQIEGLEANLSDNHTQTYDFARMQQEIKNLRDENAALSSARGMNHDLMRGLGQVGEDDDLSAVRSSLYLPKSGVSGRSHTTAGRGSVRNSLTRSDTISRSNSVLNRPLPDLPDADKLKAVELQRDALQTTARLLRDRLAMQSRKYEKQITQLQADLDRLNNNPDAKPRGGYEREVRGLRLEINVLRRRADDALEQKWQCEKGLSGLKMDLDRSKQETADLQRLLQVRDSEDPEQFSDALRLAIDDLEKLRKQSRETMPSLKAEQKLAHQLEESAERSEALAAQVREQLEANTSLRQRLINAVEDGESNQKTSTTQITDLQSKLKSLEDTITSAQIQSETAVMRHEEELNNLKVSHNAQLQRAKAGIRSPTSAKSPLSPMFANSRRSPRLDNTSSGPGQSLNEVLKTEFLEKKVAELEKALGDAESGMEDVVGRMNQAQISVFELQQERDDAIRRTRKLEDAVLHERQRIQALITGSMDIDDE